MRTFIAIDLDKKIKDTITTYIEQQNRFHADVKWASRQGLHLTLKFLGEINNEKALRTESILDFVTKDINSFPLTFKGTGCFPSENRAPRVFWIGIQEHKNILPLQKAIETNLKNIGFPLEKRKYHPHLTLGRVRSNRNLEILKNELTYNQEKNFGSMTINNIIFFQSTLKPTGAEYTIISKHLLKQ